MAKLPAIPSIPGNIDPALFKILSPIKQALESGAFNKALSNADKPPVLPHDSGPVTPEDLVNAGLPEEWLSTVPPPMPTGLAPIGAIGYNLVRWQWPTYGNHAHTEIWRATADNFSLATLVAMSPSSTYMDPFDTPTQAYYWVRFVSKTGLKGPYNSPTGSVAKSRPLINGIQPGEITQDLLAAKSVRALQVDTLDLVTNTAITGELVANSGFVDKLTSNTAFIEGLTANNAYIQSLTAKAAFIRSVRANVLTANSITANMIDSRGLTVRDAAGNVILGVGSPLPVAYADPGLRNDRQEWSQVNNRPAEDAIRNNLIDVSWWRRDGPIPWVSNAEYNRIVYTSPSDGDVSAPGPKGGGDTVWYCHETTGDGQQGGGWNSVPISLDPTKTYRFVLPVYRIRGNGQAYWGTYNVCDLNTQNSNANPYFASSGGLKLGQWYLCVGYIYPAGSVGNTHESAGMWDCNTGEKVVNGKNWCFAPGNGNVFHRAYQYYADKDAHQLMGRPMVNLVDGSEPSLREYFAASAVLNTQQQWGHVSGAGRPQDNATVGANADNFTGKVGGANLCVNSSFEQHATDPYLAEGWQIYNNAGQGVQPVSYSVLAGGVDGGKFQRIAWSVGDTSGKGLYREFACANGWQPYKTYTISFYARASGGLTPGYEMEMRRWNTHPISTDVLENPTLTLHWQRYVYRITWGASVEANGRLFLCKQVGASGMVDFDHVQVQEGNVVTAWSGALSGVDAINGSNRNQFFANDALTAVGMTMDPNLGLVIHKRGDPNKRFFVANSDSAPWIQNIISSAPANGALLVGDYDAANNRQFIRALSATGSVDLSTSSDGISVVVNGLGAELDHIALHADLAMTTHVTAASGFNFMLEPYSVYRITGTLWVHSPTNSGVTVMAKAPEGSAMRSVVNTVNSAGSYTQIPNSVQSTIDGRFYAIWQYSTIASPITDCPHAFDITVVTQIRGGLFQILQGMTVGTGILRCGSFMKLDKLRKTLALAPSISQPPWGMPNYQSDQHFLRVGSVTGIVGIYINSDGTWRLSGTQHKSGNWNNVTSANLGAGCEVQFVAAITGKARNTSANLINDASNWMSLGASRSCVLQATTTSPGHIEAHGSARATVTIYLRLVGGPASSHTITLDVDNFVNVDDH
ncbi:hypothetical protein [Chitinimonas sp. BJB300]|uniref:hypothetical protein n=3 Tax=Chitinimonas sp. BJB300 TaxID=1559339 RepID=UPI001112049C|nr:hypothetical protein [Chitinimonas sp. BJB300]TSJ83877.1 hypothetical protein FG002_020330 [Chitinimonas sp. BJB300]